MQARYYGRKLVYIPKMRPYTLRGLCLYLDVNRVYLNKFESERAREGTATAKDFCNIITRIRDVIYNQKFCGAAAGLFDPKIIALDLGLHKRLKTY